MSVQVDGKKRGFKANADYSSTGTNGQFLIVSLVTGNDNVVALSTSATDLKIVGVLQNKPKAGDAAEVTGRFGGGTGLVIAGGTINMGDYLTTNGSSQAITTTTSGNEVFGRALHAAASGDVLEFAPFNGKY